MATPVLAFRCGSVPEIIDPGVRFAVYHLTSTANPEDDHVSIGARVTGDAYLGHVFWDTEIYLLPFYTAVWPEAARASTATTAARRAREGSAFRFQGRAC